MRILLLISLILIISPRESLARSQCSRVFGALRIYRGQQIRELFSGHMVTHKSKKRSMFVKIEKPEGVEPTRWLFLVHGLLDSHVGWNQMANLALTQGYGIVRVDLHGHARTLVQNRRNSEEILDSNTSYKTNVNDVIQILKKVKAEYGISNPYLIGHSYGGGIVTAIAAHPFGKYLIANEITIIAPYIYRIDGYQAESKLYYLGGLPFLRFVRRLIPPSVRAQLESVTSDVYTDKIMQRLYAKHFTELLEQRVPRYRKDNINRLRTRSLRIQRLMERTEIIERHVQAAIDITKGVREFDGREVVGSLRENISLNLILGQYDRLVPRDLEMEFFNQVQARGIDAHLFDLPTGHMVINEAPALLFRTIHSRIAQQSP